jgi:hypothetical protein
MNPLYLLLLVFTLSAPTAQTVLVRTIDGKIHQAQLEKCALDEGVAVRTAEGQSKQWRCEDLDEICWPTTKEFASSGPWLVQTWDEDSIRCSITDGNEEQLTVKHMALGNLKLDLDRIKTIARADEPARTPMRNEEDAVLLTTGEQLSGVVIAVSQDGLTLAQGEEQRKLAWSAIRSIETAAPDDTRSGLRALLYLADGSRLLASSFDIAADRLDARLAAGQPISVPLAMLSKIEFLGTRRVWLSQLAPKSYKSKPYLGGASPWQADRNIRGGPLAINGQAFTRGLGLQSACTMTWTLAGQYDRLTLSCGIDDAAGPWADADLTILVDGRAAVGPLRLQFKQASQSVDIKLAGAKELTIEVGFGKNGDVQDFVDLCSPALIHR